jgi:nitrile hydratase
MSADHDHHHHADDHQHDEHEHSDVPSDVALRAKALQSLLVEKGIVDQAVLDRFVEEVEHEIGPHLGARVVAKAWVDPDFRQRLLSDARVAVESLGIEGWRHGARLVALPNDAEVHNVVVCTLCSCYPIPLLGPPPVWYKSAPYRSRAVMDPRGVLAEFGTVLPDSVDVRVWDSTAETRYLVVPERPSGTEDWTEEQLAALVTRNSMIGVEPARSPQAQS